MSNSDRTGRGRRRARPDAPNRAPRESDEAGGVRDSGSDAETGAQRGAGAPGRGRRTGASQARRGGRPGAPVDPVSKFSASALRRVSVLGDRPAQVVYGLAEQSTRAYGTKALAGLLALCVVALVALLSVLTYQLANATVAGTGTTGSSAIVAPPEGHSTLVPELYQSQPEDDAFEPIADRPDGAGPIPEDELFGSDTEELELDGQKLIRDQTETTDTCTSMVWGEAAAESLVEAECTSAASAVFLDSGEEYIAQFTLFDLSSQDSAGSVAEALDPGEPSTAPGFLLPQKDGVDGLHKDYSQATAQVMGHYLAVYWVARTDGAEPGDDDTLSTVNVAAMNASTWVYRQVGEAEQK
ncbi:hypothetical protein [Streptomonospora salina]|uniref:Uncharacterized protein n=1 Tax=Streptomonospora salina TaxID=104205 RepID=A0A841E1W5_9ACTN|nr:hypothetical protein [Streptomonospora salina]MBB5996692.1 hypothetical protein [Streptomonospora salina]